MAQFFTVGDLRKVIEHLDDSVPIVRMTHYGAAITIGKYAIYARDPVTIVDDAWQMSQPHHATVKALVIEPPDIGPEPD